MVRVRGEDAFEHLVDRSAAVIDKFLGLHADPPGCRVLKGYSYAFLTQDQSARSMDVT
jgi:hypothetical protein